MIFGLFHFCHGLLWFGNSRAAYIVFADTVGFGLVRANRPVLLLCDRGQRAHR